MRTDHASGSLWWARQIGSWLVALTAIALLAVMVVIPRIAGATPYTVASGSMRPTYQPGTLVVVRPVDVNDIGIGTPITFQLESGSRAVVTHRVVAIKYSTSGERQYITRGDANGAVDAEPVRPVQVRGAVWYDVGHLGYLNSMLSGRQHQLLVWTVAAVLGAYAAVMFAGALRGRLSGGGGRRPSGAPQAARMPERLR
jgi:signal peptidase